MHDPLIWAFQDPMAPGKPVSDELVRSEKVLLDRDIDQY
jgi:hypothetical protein